MHVRLCARERVYVCVRVCVLLGQRVVQTRVYQPEGGGGEEDIIAPDPGLGQVTQSGTSLAQSFLLVTLQVTSTSMRYDRYDTLRFHVRTRNLNVVQIVVQESPVPRLAKFSNFFHSLSPDFARARERERERRREKEGRKREKKGGGKKREKR